MSNYPDDMRSEDIRYVEGTRAIDVAAEKFDDLSDKEQLEWWLIEDPVHDDPIAIDVLAKLLEHKEVCKLIIEMLKNRHIKGSYEAAKARWIDAELEDMER